MTQLGAVAAASLRFGSERVQTRLNRLHDYRRQQQEQQQQQQQPKRQAQEIKGDATSLSSTEPAGGVKVTSAASGSGPASRAGAASRSSAPRSILAAMQAADAALHATVATLNRLSASTERDPAAASDRKTAESVCLALVPIRCCLMPLHADSC